jgi:hypothetical protein
VSFFKNRDIFNHHSAKHGIPPRNFGVFRTVSIAAPTTTTTTTTATATAGRAIAPLSYTISGLIFVILLGVLVAFVFISVFECTYSDAIEGRLK